MLARRQTGALPADLVGAQRRQPAPRHVHWRGSTSRPRRHRPRGRGGPVRARGGAGTARGGTATSSAADRRPARSAAAPPCPDPGPVRDVVVGERLGVVLVAELLVPAQGLGCAGSGEAVEIHGQEGDVEQDVADPQRHGEGQAVEDPGPVVQAEDVVGEQVAVAVADQAVADPLLRTARRGGRGTRGEELDPLHHRPGRVAPARRHHGQVVVPFLAPRHARRWRAPSGWGDPAEWNTAMRRATCPQAPVQLRRAGEGAETAVVRQAAHHDHRSTSSPCSTTSASPRYTSGARRRLSSSSVAAASSRSRCH